MTKFEIVTRLFSVIPVFLFVLSNIYGMRYDAVSEKYNKNYKGNHSVVWKNGRLWCSIPRYIFEKNITTEIEKAKRDYNKLSVLFWITTPITFILVLI